MYRSGQPLCDARQNCFTTIFSIALNKSLWLLLTVLHKSFLIRSCLHAVLLVSSSKSFEQARRPRNWAGFLTLHVFCHKWTSRLFVTAASFVTVCDVFRLCVKFKRIYDLFHFVNMFLFQVFFYIFLRIPVSTNRMLSLIMRQFSLTLVFFEWYCWWQKRHEHTAWMLLLLSVDAPDFNNVWLCDKSRRILLVEICSLSLPHKLNLAALCAGMSLFSKCMLSIFVMGKITTNWRF